MQEQIEVNYSKLDPAVIDFIAAELEKCRQHSISIKMPYQKTVIHSGVRCAGYFEQDPLEFAVAVGRSHKFWLNTFVHETCHIDQWREDLPIWYEKVNGNDPLDLMDDWLQCNVELDQESINKMFDIVIEIELDCERRSVEKIKQYNLPIKIDTYIKKSNAYVWSYRLIQTTRTWDHTGAYEFPEVWRKMPKHFNNDYTRLPDNIATVFYANIEKIIRI
jgi:hypothetical protein